MDPDDPAVVAAMDLVRWQAVAYGAEPGAFKDVLRLAKLYRSQDIV
jgi:hypothetical protein